MKERSKVRQIFASHADCEDLNGGAAADDAGDGRPSVAGLHARRLDDFLQEISAALVEAGVGRHALMRVFLRHALRDEDGLRKRPSTSELIDWIAALRRAGLGSKDLDKGLPFLGVLLKREQDLVQHAERQAGGRGRA